MKYEIVVETSPEKLGNTVTQFLEEGWTCQGGVAVGNDQFLQAMINYDQIALNDDQ